MQISSYLKEVLNGVTAAKYEVLLLSSMLPGVRVENKQILVDKFIPKVTSAVPGSPPPVSTPRVDTDTVRAPLVYVLMCTSKSFIMQLSLFLPQTDLAEFWPVGLLKPFSVVSFLGCIECVLPMCTVSVCLSVMRLNTAARAVCVAQSRQPLPNYFSLLLNMSH